MRTVFLFLKNSLFISDLLKTNYIKYLSQKYRVVVFSSTLDPTAGEYFSSLNVEYIKWKLQNPKLFAVTKFLRTACMHEFDNVSSLQFYYGSPAFQNDKRARILRFLSRPFARFLTVNFFTKIELFFMRRSKLFEKYCEKYNPALIIVSTPGVQIFDAEAILLGKKMGISTLATNSSWDNLTSFKCVRSRKPDYLFLWNEVMKEAALKIHQFSPERIFVTGSMRFDKYFDAAYPIIAREKFLKSKNLNLQYKTILFASGGRAPQQAEVLKKIIDARAEKKIPYVNILIRPHPFDDPANYFQFRDVADVCLELAGKEDFINLKSTLANTDININFKSTITLESFIFDKPVINFTIPELPFQNKHYFDENSYYYPIIKEKSVFLANDNDEMMRGINQYLADPKLDSDNRRRVADKFFAFRDGLSYRRNVDFLGSIVKD